MESYSSLAEIQASISAGTTSCLSLVDTYLSRIERNKSLNTFLEVFKEDALEQAKTIDQQIADGGAGKLAGLVIGIKDNICYKGHAVSAASKILEGFQSTYSATVVDRLMKEGAIIIGRLNCDEFAMGSSNENSAYGPVLNPFNHSRVPGGSSGGSAAAVAADLCHAALGSDTGGSIRQPASFCGVVGMKPTYGRVSRHGLIAYGSSFDQIGPITRCVPDAALILEVMAGFDEFDNTTSLIPVPEYSKNPDFSDGLRIAYLEDCMNKDGLDEEIRDYVSELVTKLENGGHTVEPVSFPYLEYMVPAYYVLTTAEASSNLSRYDGIHYGYRSDQVTDLESTYKVSRSEGFGEEVQRRIMLGTFVLSAGYYDAYYTKGMKVRKVIQDKTLEVLSQYDFIILPTSPHTAFPFGNNVDPISMYLEDVFTVQANLSGVPAISLPMGKHSNGLPFGVQVMANSFEEEALFAFSDYLINSCR